MNILLLLIASFAVTHISAVQFTCSQTDAQQGQSKTLLIECHLDENEAIFANSLRSSADDAAIHVNDPIINIQPINKYIPEFKQIKNVYDQNFSITVDVQCLHTPHRVDGTIYLGYLSTTQKAMTDFTIPVTFTATEQSDLPIALERKNPLVSTPNFSNTSSWTKRIEKLVETTKSPWIQILFAMILGLLLSLTPCIYPMIPITIGILHSNGKKSLLHNFLGSMSYACGIATTFASLGLLATTVAGNSFGSLLSNTPFVLCLVAFIGYMSLTMIGIIDMYIPPFMQGQITFYKNLSPFLGAYIFGAISGTIASPCVSPGLALLLSIVVTLGNKILGFFLLFAFGIGLSTPLIIIATFSNSLYLLPKSGMWMVEIKKGLGFFMMATCFYYLANVLPLAVVYWLGTAFTLFVASFYLIHSNQEFKTLYNSISIIMISLTIFLASKSYEKTFYQPVISTEASIIDWQPDYQTAVQLAEKENKLLLIDFWANHCTICKAIDKKVFLNKIFKEAIEQDITCLKINATDSSSPEYLFLAEKYQIYALPAILLIDPTTQTIVDRWSSEPYAMSIQEFINQIKNHVK